jgi:D-alanyl-D-alanine carboxypeptidase
MTLKLIAFFLFISGNLFSQEIEKEKFDNYINYIENNNGGIGNVSIFKNGGEVYNRSFGQRKLINVNYNEDTKYQIASLTKMITVILVFTERISNTKQQWT